MGNAEREIVPYEYKDTVFELSCDKDWHGNILSYSIVKLKEYGEVVEFPSAYGRYPVVTFRNGVDTGHLGGHEREKLRYPGVRKLIFPKELGVLRMDNETFPELAVIEISPEHETYYTDGKMLYEKGKDGLILILALAAGMNEKKVVIPEAVKEVARHAFLGTKCEEVIFENPDIRVDSSAFERSVWLEKQGDVVYIGTTLYKIKKTFHEAALKVREGTTRFDVEAFAEVVPSKIITHVIPPLAALKRTRGNRKGCRSLTLTSKSARVNLNTLRLWDSLAKIHFIDHKKYMDIDGVVFSRDGKSLLFCPQYYPVRDYQIPQGVVRIGSKAFYKQNYIQRIDMPDSVRVIQQGAFYGCMSLERIRLSENVSEIIDANIFSPEGVFAACGQLKCVVLPEKLKYIGSFAFFHTAMEEICIPEKVRQIGEYAFASTGLEKVALPRACHIVGNGAFSTVREVTACEGTARGLVPALEAALPADHNRLANIQWHEVRITMLDRQGNILDRIWIPESLKHAAAFYVDMAWNGEEFDYEAYYNCFSAVQDNKEKLEFAANAVKRIGDITGTEFETYYRHMGKKIAVALVEKRQEESLIRMLKEGYLSDAALDTLLKLCNEAEMATAVGYILKQKERNGEERKKGAQKGYKIKKTAAIRL